MLDCALTSEGTLAETRMNQPVNLQVIISCIIPDTELNLILKLLNTIVTIQVNIHPTSQWCSKSS
jgi:hypothetical protein